MWMILENDTHARNCRTFFGQTAQQESLQYVWQGTRWWKGSGDEQIIGLKWRLSLVLFLPYMEVSGYKAYIDNMLM